MIVGVRVGNSGLEVAAAASWMTKGAQDSQQALHKKRKPCKQSARRGRGGEGERGRGVSLKAVVEGTVHGRRVGPTSV